jgi:Raf kinase inhibitor-like YbhB/YbcL family protein
MKVQCNGIVNGHFEEKYGCRGSQFGEAGYDNYSIPFEIIDPPQGAVSYAILLEDRDAVPVTRGFSWIHWVACNFTRTSIKENESASAKDFVQGLNSYISPQGGSKPSELCASYCGMAPPDRPHVYELHVYALDKKLDLANGFYMNEMFRKMDGHVLASCTIQGIYKNS